MRRALLWRHLYKQTSITFWHEKWPKRSFGLEIAVKWAWCFLTVQSHRTFREILLIFFTWNCLSSRNDRHLVVLGNSGEISAITYERSIVNEIWGTLKFRYLNYPLRKWQQSSALQSLAALISVASRNNCPLQCIVGRNEIVSWSSSMYVEYVKINVNRPRKKTQTDFVPRTEGTFFVRFLSLAFHRDSNQVPPIDWNEPSASLR